MKTLLAYNLGSLVAAVSRLLGWGTGVTWSGEVALKIDPQFIVNNTRKVNNRILVAGTNGKTTTAALIAHVLTRENFTVIHNKTGANLLNGIAGTLIKNYEKIATNSVCILETDEAAFPEIVKQVKPTIIVLLNLFRDQLDRYGEVDVIAEKWEKVVSRLPANTIILANGDDPLIVHIASTHKGKVLYFGLNDPELSLDTLEHATDSSYCLDCGTKLSYRAIYLSHQGDWYCENCGKKRPELEVDSTSSTLAGVYSKYNDLAATLAISQFKISRRLIGEHFPSFVPAFGRQEEFEKNGKKIRLFLSKNPTGFNESLRTALVQKDVGCFLFVLNDRIPDGADVSWIWDVDFEMMGSSPIHIICTGDRTHDIALRIKYSKDHGANGPGGQESEKVQKAENKLIVEPSLNNAIHMGLEKIKKGKTLYVLATYSAMLDVRKILTGKKIL